MSPEEFVSWQQYFREEPFGSSANAWLIASQTAHLINAELKLNRFNSFKADDFMPKVQISS